MTTPDIDLSTYSVRKNPHGGRSLWQRIEDGERPVPWSPELLDVLAAALDAVERLTEEKEVLRRLRGQAEVVAERNAEDGAHWRALFNRDKAKATGVYVNADGTTSPILTSTASAEVIERVREVRDHYASPTSFPPDALVPTDSVVNRLDAALGAGGAGGHVGASDRAQVTVDHPGEGAVDLLSYILLRLNRIEDHLGFPKPEGDAELEWVDCTCGHPNADHEAGVCPFRGCGCGALDAADRAQSDGGAR